MNRRSFFMSEIDYQIEDFMTHCQTKGLSKKTMLSYEQTIKLFAKYVADNYKITDAKKVTEDMIRDYIKNLQKRGKYTFVANQLSKEINCPENRKDYGEKISTTTINNYLRNIKVFFNFLQNYRIIRKNPMQNIKTLKNERKALGFIQDRDFLRLLRHIDTTKFPEYRDYIIIQLIFDTGMRIGECLDLLVTDIDFQARAIDLRAETTKAKKDRTVFFSPKMSEELKKWIQYKDRYIESDYLFPSRKLGHKLQIGNFETNFKKYANRVGLNNAHPHMLRNNFAKRCLMNGMDIYTLSRILGHSSVTVTERAYLDLTNDDIRKNYQRFSPLSNLKRY